MGRMNLRMGASGVGSKVWVLTIGVLEVNPEWDSIRFLVDYFQKLLSKADQIIISQAKL